MQKSGKRAGVAVVGAGNWGRNLVRNFAQLGALRGIVDVQPDRCNALSERHSVPCLTWESVLEDRSISAVAIATPPSLHFTQARQALLAGKHVFVEKPLAVASEKPSELVEMARRRKLTLMCGHIMRYHPGFRKLLELVKRGDIGRLRYAYSNRLTFNPEGSGEGVLWDFAPHDISMILPLADGMPELVTAAASPAPNGAEFVNAQLFFAGAFRADIHVSRLHPFKEHRLVVIGESGSLVFEDSKPDARTKLMHFRRGSLQDGETSSREFVRGEPVAYSPREPLRLECLDFLQSIKKGVQPLTNGAEALKVFEVLARIEHAIPEGTMAAEIPELAPARAIA